VSGASHGGSPARRPLRHRWAGDRATVAQPTGSGDQDRAPSGGGDVTSEWWFWTLIAVLVVGAGVGITAGVVVATSGVDQPPPGTVPVVTALGEW
jgi:hypothetical protein